MKFYYINHKNEKIDLSGYPYVFQAGDLLNWNYQYDNDGTKATNFRKELKEHKCTIAVLRNPTVSQEKNLSIWRDAMDRLSDVIVVDVLNNKNGKLYTDKGSYLECKIVASNKSVWRKGLAVNELTVLTDSNSWITEQHIQIGAISEAAAMSEATGTKTYPYTYPYRYPILQTETTYDIDHYTDSHFQMIIYGPTIGVHVNIAGHPYIVDYELKAGEYMVIDSRPYVDKEKRLYVVRANGDTESIFDYRSAEYSVFQKIPPGRIKIDYSRTYGVDLIIFKERSEPPWKL